MKISGWRKFNLLWIFVATAPLFLFGLFAFPYSLEARFKILLIAALFYLALALMHHQKDKTLTFEIIIEYILIAALALVVLQGLNF